MHDAKLLCEAEEEHEKYWNELKFHLCPNLPSVITVASTRVKSEKDAKWFLFTQEYLY